MPNPVRDVFRNNEFPVYYIFWLLYHHHQQLQKTSSSTYSGILQCDTFRGPFSSAAASKAGMYVWNRFICLQQELLPHIPRNANISSSLIRTFHVSKSSEIAFSIVNFIIVWLQVVTSPFDRPFCFGKPIRGRRCKPLSLPFYVAETIS